MGEVKGRKNEGKERGKNRTDDRGIERNRDVEKGERGGKNRIE